MPPPVKKRSYVSPTRDARAAATRARILQAASQLFLESGYGRTSTAAIARAAHTSEANVFAVFGSKAELLVEVVMDHVRSDPTFTMRDEARWAPFVGAPDPMPALQEFASVVRRAHDRSWRIRSVAAAAAHDDPSVREANARGAARRRSDCEWLLSNVLGVPAARLQATSDAVWTLINIENYRLLVIDRSWAPAWYEAWLAEMLRASLEGAMGDTGTTGGR